MRVRAGRVVRGVVRRGVRLRRVGLRGRRRARTRRLGAAALLLTGDPVVLLVFVMTLRVVLGILLVLCSRMKRLAAGSEEQK